MGEAKRKREQWLRLTGDVFSAAEVTLFDHSHETLGKVANLDQVDRFCQLLNRLDRNILRVNECKRCGASVVFEQFSLHNEVWVQTGLGPYDGYLCVTCTETAIGRRLVKADFTNPDALNDYWPSTSRLEERRR